VWCRTLGVEALPAAPDVLAAYLSELAQPGDDRVSAAVATIERGLSAIAQAHRVAGFPSPRSDALVAETLRGVRRLLGVAPKGRKAGALTADIKAAVAAIDLETMVGMRDRALLLVGFAGAMRRSELVALDVADLEAALEGYVANLRVSKTTRNGPGGTSRWCTAPTRDAARSGRFGPG
jgi:integrase